MSDLDAALAWLRARLDDEEAAAHAAGGNAWATGRTAGHTYGRHGDQPFGTVISDGDGEWPRPETVEDSHVYEVGGPMLILDPLGGPGVCRHVARQDPASTLARVAALRDLLAECDSARAYYGVNRAAPAGEVHGLWTAVKLLARPWVDLPDFPQALRA